MKWIKDLISPKTRAWEEFYRNRWQHDKVVRSTHGVNCTGGCSWNIYVKEGIVTWEMQALDYPAIDPNLPPYEPRGCQRGISFSWYLYSPIRVKYPYVRGALLDIWRKARKQYDDPVEAWASIQADPELRGRYQRARGKGGFRRVSIDEAIEIAAASTVHTIKTHGPDRVYGFSPIPAMSQLSYAGGARFMQLMGGVNLSFYDWYCDLPNASPEAWGEQTDVAESADWYHSKMIAIMGSNPNMTRTPDCHYVAECRHNGTKLVVFAPDFNQVAKYADQWVAINAGQDGAFWMAVGHVILKEFYLDNPTPTFESYVKQYTDLPFLVELAPSANGHRPGRLLRAGDLDGYADEENGEWKFAVLDKNTGQPRMPGGSMGHRWGQTPGKWNLKLEDAKTGEPIDPVLSLIDLKTDAPLVEFEEYDQERGLSLRAVPAMKIRKKNGDEVLVTTAFDLLLARYGVKQGDLAGEYPSGYEDENGSYTPAWQERWTGVSAKTAIGFAREWARTAEKTGGKCCIIIGAGINHWYHNNLMYRAGIVALILTGCVGKNGGGLNHYVGQEKLAPVASWSQIAFARDWVGPPRLQNAPSWHYIHSDQWRYEAEFTEYHPVPEGTTMAQGHAADLQVRAVRSGWLPFYPQFNESSIEVVRKARKAGAKNEADVVANVVSRLKDGSLKFAVQDPDAPECWPRVWFIWRGNALMSSAKGHEYFLKHYLGTHHNAIAKERAEGSVKDVKWRDAPEGKMDIIIDLNFRMDTSALYSDVILPAATWYEKADLNSTDMHSYIHPLSEAVPPAWESRSDWDLFRMMAGKVAELARRHMPEPIEDLVMSALAHDSPAEIAQSEPLDWTKGEVEPIPGKTMPAFKLVTRDYARLWQHYIALGPGIRANGVGAHGASMDVKEEYDEMVARGPTVLIDGHRYPSLKEAQHACNAVLFLAPETNGEIAFKGYKNLEKKTGVPLVDLAEANRGTRVSYSDLLSQPRRLLNSPCWTGLMTNGRSYSAFTTQIERLVPFRTLTGRQHLYLDHQGYLDFGEHLPTYKPIPLPAALGDLRDSTEEGMALNYLTPHGKWHIHSTYGDTLRMMTLNRGCEPIWLNDKDAAEMGVADNDYCEVHNDHGVVVTRAVVSARIPRGVCIIYHSPERTLNIPRSPIRQGRRAGGHNSLTRVRLKPVLMVGGYGQFTYHFNYWGPTGVNRDTTVRVRKLERVSY